MPSSFGGRVVKAQAGACCRVPCGRCAERIKEANNIPVSRFPHSSHINCGAGEMAAHILNRRWAGRPIFMLW